MTSAPQLFGSSLSCPPAQRGLNHVQKKGEEEGGWILGVLKFLALRDLDQTASSPHGEESPGPTLDDIHRVVATCVPRHAFVIFTTGFSHDTGGPHQAL